MMRSEIQFAVNYGINYLKQRLAYQFDQPFNKPTQVAISITDACAARCVMCDVWKLQGRDELTAPQWIEFLSQMRKWLGPFWLSISGGEPFHKPGIVDILKSCRDNQIKTKISSNGMLLVPSFLDRILPYGPDFLSSSIDSPRAVVHDKLRGTPGLHARCREALLYLRARNQRIVLGVTTVIMEDNYRDLPDLVRWSLDQGVDRMVFQPLQANFGSLEKDANWYKKSPHWVQDTDALGGVVDEQLAMKQAGFPNLERSTPTGSIQSLLPQPSYAPSAR